MDIIEADDYPAEVGEQIEVFKGAIGEAMTKVCARCGRRLSLSHFGETRNGHRKVCKRCNEKKKMQVNAKYKGQFWVKMDKLLCSN